MWPQQKQTYGDRKETIHATKFCAEKVAEKKPAMAQQLLLVSITRFNQPEKDARSRWEQWLTMAKTTKQFAVMLQTQHSIVWYN